MPSSYNTDVQKFWDNSCGAGISAREGSARDAVADKNVRAPQAFPASLRIGGVRISPATVLAPMSGVTDTVFRRFIRNLGGCGLIMTEFTSADGVLRDQRVRGRYLHFYEDEHPISAQLFGSNPSVLADAARMVEDLGFDLVDLNLGCPAKKVVKCNGGSGLLRDLPMIRQIFESVRAAVKIPFTVKFRAGWNDSEIICVELARLAEDCGLAAVAACVCSSKSETCPATRSRWRAAEDASASSIQPKSSARSRPVKSNAPALMRLSNILRLATRESSRAQSANPLSISAVRHRPASAPRAHPDAICSRH